MSLIIDGKFMADHPNFAKNLIPNCEQDLPSKLNSYDPPVKNASAWRNVYADQKREAKKKLIFNKACKRSWIIAVTKTRLS